MCFYCLAEASSTDRASMHQILGHVLYLVKDTSSCILVVQDTLYLHYGKQYLKDCYIEGSVDFIFGNSTALLEHCHIHCKSAGFITAQSRKSSQETTGYVFLRFVFSQFCLTYRLIMYLVFIGINFIGKPLWRCNVQLHLSMCLC